MLCNIKPVPFHESDKHIFAKIPGGGGSGPPVPPLWIRPWCYSYNPERQGGKPLLSVLKTLICRGRGSNPRPPTHEADTLTTRPPR